MRLGDKGHDTDDVRYAGWSRGTLAMIPTKSNRKVRFSVDRALCSMRHYSMRNRIERSFNKIKNARRMATRYDTLAATFLGSVEIVSIRYWIRFFNDNLNIETATASHRVSTRRTASCHTAWRVFASLRAICGRKRRSSRQCATVGPGGGNSPACKPAR